MRVIIDDETEDVVKDTAPTNPYRQGVLADLKLLERPLFSWLSFKKNPYEKDLLKRSKKRWRGDKRLSDSSWTKRSTKYHKLGTV